MKNNRLFIFVLFGAIVFAAVFTKTIIAPSFKANKTNGKMKMMGKAMIGDASAKGMMGGGRGMMGGMNLMRAWLSGKTLPVDFETPKPPENKKTIEAGKIIYESRCAVCHGVKGDGNGKRANDLHARPLDFSLGFYKFRSTPYGAPPTDKDIFITVSRGLHGTAMLPWLGLTTAQKWFVTYYVKTFSDIFEFYYEDGKKQIVIKTPEPTMSVDEYIKLGKVVYGKSECARCHGPEGRGDGKQADKLKDDWDRPIRPANFRAQTVKRGIEIEDIYLTLATGLNGTPMLSFSKTLSTDEIMSLAYYIRSISPPIKRAGMMGMMGRGATYDEHAGMMIDHVMMPQ